MTPTVEQATLYFREGTSDKVYHAAIEPQGQGFVVQFAYGRRGATLNTGTKTNAPVDLDKARSIYAKLVQSKLAKGYTPGEDGAAYRHTDREERFTGQIPQLLTFIGRHEVPHYIADPAWGAQEKKDGKRLQLQRDTGSVTGINRKGLTCGFPAAFAHAAEAVLGTTGLLDGEAVGEVFHAFDLLEHDGEDLRPLPYEQRHCRLCALVNGHGAPIQPVALAVTAAEKQALFDRLEKEGREGIVFKRLDAPHRPGKPASGGDWVKFKFYETASMRVESVHPSKRSVEIAVMDEAGTPVPVGNVTIPPNHKVPAPETIVEVRYLYAFRGGSLYQPQYLGPRDDLEAADCSIDQLKYKAEDA